MLVEFLVWLVLPFQIDVRRVKENPACEISAGQKGDSATALGAVAERNLFNNCGDKNHQKATHS